jgi:hypothetical protein
VTQKWGTFELTVVAQVLVSVAGIICFVGFVLLSIYVGNGLIMLPYKLVVQWWEQPKKMSPAELVNLKNGTKRKLKKLVDLGKDLRSRIG